MLYTLNKGVFLVMLDGTKVIGMGALQYFNAEICELRRMFFRPEYRGRGLGSKMVTRLLQIAGEFGYKKIRLTVYNPSKQVAAVGLYKKFAFCEIAAYNDNPKVKLSIEKLLPINNLTGSIAQK